MFMMGLVIAGEAIFGLPFHVARFFRSTVLRVFDFTNTELGAAQAVYGIVAMIAYVAGGPLADRYSARKLLVASLVSTAASGLYMATIPGSLGAGIMFGYWGATTIFLFWAALIRATRDWGGRDEQGRAYGVLDGGRGLLAAVTASAAVLLFRLFFPDDVESVTDLERRAALQGVIYIYSLVTLGAAVLVWFVVPDQEPAAADASERPSLFSAFGPVVRLPSVWLQALIVVCAYVGFKGLDNYSLFAVEGYGMNEIEAAQVTTLGAWVRPVAAVGAGLLGDRIRSSRVIIGGFAILLVSDLWFGLTQPTLSTPWILIGNVLFACTAIFGLRGVYFALFEEAQVPIGVTGTAVGFVSLVGYTPDVFVGVVGGLLLDRSPGVTGHQHFFLFMASFAALGLAASLLFERINRHHTA